MSALAGSGVTRRLTTILAIVCGATIANLYYAQPLLAPIRAALGIGVDASGLIVTLFQLGYVAGLVLLAPLGDLLENRALIVRTLSMTVLALLIVATARSASTFLLGASLVGISSSAVQMILPVVAHLAPEQTRGRVVGTVTGGLLFGILFARPTATLVAGAFGWRAIFGVSAGVMVFATIAVARVLPERRPTPGLRYLELVRSLGVLLVRTPVLQRRAGYHALLFAAFILFWTTAPLLLVAPPFSLGPVGLSLFMLSGAVGALVAPLAGWIADRGWTGAATALAFAMTGGAFVLARLGATSLSALVVAGVILDAGVQTNLVLGQRAIYMLDPKARSRLNGLYIALFFFGGAFGSAIAGSAFARGGWGLVTMLGISFPLVAAIAFATEGRRALARLNSFTS